MQTLLICLVLVVAAMVAMWMLSLKLRDASVVDPAWGMGFVLVAWVALMLNSPPTSRTWLLAILTTIWGVRLSTHLLIRYLHHGEDRRYASMREKHGDRFWWVSLFTVFLLQAVLLWIIAWPIQVTASAAATPLGWLDGLGVLVWGIGLFFESVGDWQLTQFKRRSSSGDVLDRGLWRYTRHPNYFGDFCVWWGIYLIAAAGGAFWTIISPLLMSIFLMRISGVTLLESTIRERRPEYASYQARTNAFFPGPPRSAVG